MTAPSLVMSMHALARCIFPRRGSPSFLNNLWRFRCLCPLDHRYDSDLSVRRHRAGSFQILITVPCTLGLLLGLEACVEPRSSRAVTGDFGTRKPSSRLGHLALIGGFQVCTPPFVASRSRLLTPSFVIRLCAAFTDLLSSKFCVLLLPLALIHP